MRGERRGRGPAAAGAGQARPCGDRQDGLQIFRRQILGPLFGEVVGRRREFLRVHAQELDDLRLDAAAQFGILFQQGADLLAALSQLFGTEGEPGTALLDDLGVKAEIQQFTGAGDALPVQDVENGAAEGRATLFLTTLTRVREPKDSSLSLRV